MNYFLPAGIFLLAVLFPRLTNRIGALASFVASAVNRRAWTGALVVAALPMTVRLILLPWQPIPFPAIHDEFSYLYAADTFAAGRLFNPSHPLWRFFETPEVVVHPRMFSKYPPAQGMLLAAGQVLFGDPWFGVWLSAGLMCAACYWLLLAMVPRNWSFLGALIVASHLALTSYWMNSYWGGNLAATAGAVVLGSYLRLRRRPRPVWAATFSAGWILLAASRPYEGAALLGLPLAISLLWRRLPGQVLMAGASVAILGGIGLGGYNMALTGRPWKLPYAVYYEQYSYVPSFFFLPLDPRPAGRQDANVNGETFDEEQYRRMNSPGRGRWLLGQWSRHVRECFPLAPLIALAVFSFSLVRARRTRWLMALLGLGIVGLSVETFRNTHYFAPFVPLTILLLVISLRKLRTGRWRQALLAASLLAAAANEAIAIYRMTRDPKRMYVLGIRPRIEAFLNERFEEHLIFVRDTFLTDNGKPHWVYNRADMERAAVIWAKDLGEEENAKLIRMYPGRKVWLLPIKPPLTLEPYGAADALQQPVKFQ